MSYLYFLGASLAGAHVTFWLSHHTHLKPIRAATVASLLFYALTSLSPGHPDGMLRIQAAFYGACFVGMSDAGKLRERDILISAILFWGLFCLVSRATSNLGGSLGTAAFLACVASHYLSKWLNGSKPESLE